MFVKYSIFAFLLLQFSEKQVEPGQQIIGQYWTGDKQGKIEIYQENGRYFGKILWRKQARKDVHNPNPTLRERSIIGMVFLKEFVFKNGKYEKGKVYSIDNGKSYSGKLWLEDDGKTLKMRGYVGVSWLGRTATLKRVEI
ncbi:MAG: DUF2147 domain-containing protein [Saprospiraceae bacterium]|nr:DUF2147 domain-containing protein [Saprospiraceae bacterium]